MSVYVNRSNELNIKVKNMQYNTGNKQQASAVWLGLGARFFVCS